MRIIWTTAAQRKLREIMNYISIDSPSEAVKYGQEIFSRTNNLLEFPDSGTVFQATEHRVIRKIIIGKTKSIFYRIHNANIYFLALHDNRQALKEIKI